MTPDSTCLTQGSVKIDPYTNLLTFDSAFVTVFNGPKEINICEIVVCVAVTNSLVPTENYTVNDKKGCGKSELCATTGCTQNGFKWRDDLVWYTDTTITIHLEYLAKLEFRSPPQADGTPVILFEEPKE